MSKELELRIDKLAAEVDTLTMAFISLIAQDIRGSTHNTMKDSMAHLKEMLLANRLASNEASEAYIDALTNSFKKLEKYIEITMHKKWD